MEQPKKQEATQLQAVLSGKEQHPNETVDYLAAQYRETRVEFEAVDLKVKNLKAMLGAEIDQLAFLRGGIAKYKNDVDHWLKKLNALIPNESKK